jgi:hypothetical protein
MNNNSDKQNKHTVDLSYKGDDPIVAAMLKELMTQGGFDENDELLHSIYADFIDVFSLSPCSSDEKEDFELHNRSNWDGELNDTINSEGELVFSYHDRCGDECFGCVDGEYTVHTLTMVYVERTISARPICEDRTLETDICDNLRKEFVSIPHYPYLISTGNYRREYNLIKLYNGQRKLMFDNGRIFLDGMICMDKELKTKKLYNESESIRFCVKGYPIVIVKLDEDISYAIVDNYKNDLFFSIASQKDALYFYYEKNFYSTIPDHYITINGENVKVKALSECSNGCVHTDGMYYRYENDPPFLMCMYCSAPYMAKPYKPLKKDINYGVCALRVCCAFLMLYKKYIGVATRICNLRPKPGRKKYKGIIDRYYKRKELWYYIRMMGFVVHLNKLQYHYLKIPHCYCSLCSSKDRILKGNKVSCVRVYSTNRFNNFSFF